jgi:hypothetical protein
LVDRALVADVARVERRLRLDQDDLAVALGERAVLDPARNDDQLTGLDDDVPVAELHAHPARDDEEQLVLVVVVVPDELAVELDDL